MIASKRHRIQFPSIDTTSLEQDEAYFFLVNGENGHPDDHRQRIRFHDYATIYSQPGLYEQLFYERLKCDSPRKVTEALRYTAEHERDNLAEMRVLDLGAGNGIMGEELKRHGVARLVGVDIVDEAREAAFRDRPHELFLERLIGQECLIVSILWHAAGRDDRQSRQQGNK